ncbi:MAG: M24 family metallopeptidase [Thermaceae bacterium]
MELSRIQEALAQGGMDGWLLYSFGPSNPLALEVLALEGHLTRRFAYFIPREGNPTLLLHAIEESLFPPLPGERRTYARWEEFVLSLREILGESRRVALEYIPGGQIPYLSRVDGGTLDLLRGMGLEVVSSWPLLLLFQVWDQKALDLHKKAAQGLARAKDRALNFLREGRLPSEAEVQEVLVEALKEEGLVFDHPPMVAFGENAANPHHTPGGRRLKKGDVVLLDLWAKHPEGVYADITWMAGWEASEDAKRAFRAVREARDKAVEWVQMRYLEGRFPRGFEVDQVARKVLGERGFSAHIRHRTGHNLGRQVHGAGPHLDDLESHDFRPLVPGLGFTVEPGVYPGPFGVRSEINVYLHPHGPEITTEVQEELEAL